MEQDPSIKAVCDNLLKAAGAPFASKDEAIAAGCCVMCGRPVEGRIYSESGKGEYQISGSCEFCFDDLVKESEEGDVCGRNGGECKGIIQMRREGGCSCHINPPCASCVDAYPYCPECGWEGEI